MGSRPYYKQALFPFEVSMSIRHTSESPPEGLIPVQTLHMIPGKKARIFLLRRKDRCKTCGRIHGPPGQGCDHTRDPAGPVPEHDDMNLPWTF